MSIYAVPSQYLPQLKVVPAKQPFLHAASISFPGSGGRIDIWANRAQPPWLDERIVLVDGLLDGATIYKEISDLIGIQKIGMFYENVWVSLPSRVLTIVPLHRGGTAHPWLQSSPEFIYDGMESPTAYRLRYEDSPAGGPSTPRDQDSFVAVRGEVEPKGQQEHNNTAADDATKILGACIELISLEGRFVTRKDFRGRTRQDIVDQGDAYMNKWNRGIPSIPIPWPHNLIAVDYSITPGRCPS